MKVILANGEIGILVVGYSTYTAFPVTYCGDVRFEYGTMYCVNFKFL